MPNFIAEALAESRSRQSWNDRLAHWEKPASDSEEQIIERAAGTVRGLLTRNTWLVGEGVEIAAQGSYHNNTNVRLESDIDLRAVHPMIEVLYADGVVKQSADALLGYTDTGKTFAEIGARMRSELTRELVAAFGERNVDGSGKKALTVLAVPGSRAPVDVVPCFRLHHVSWNPAYQRYIAVEGIVIRPSKAPSILNFPEQHYANGVRKRADTQHRFKKNVRMFKRLRDELVEAKMIESVPSFLIESLVYAVEDHYFTVPTDDRYDCLKRIIARIHEKLNEPSWVSGATEINETKLLFGTHQPWSPSNARALTAAAWNRLTA